MEGALHFDDFQLEKSYQYAAAYNQSKLANLMLAFELERRSKAAGWGFTSIAAHPGVARTNIIPDGPGPQSEEGRMLGAVPFLFEKASRGALPTLYAATSPQAAPGGYYGPNGFQEFSGEPGFAAVLANAKDAEAASRLWTTLEGLAQVSFA